MKTFLSGCHKLQHCTCTALYYTEVMTLNATDNGINHQAWVCITWDERRNMNTALKWVWIIGNSEQIKFTYILKYFWATFLVSERQRWNLQFIIHIWFYIQSIWAGSEMKWRQQIVSCCVMLMMLIHPWSVVKLHDWLSRESTVNASVGAGLEWVRKD